MDYKTILWCLIKCAYRKSPTLLQLTEQTFQDQYKIRGLSDLFINRFKGLHDYVKVWLFMWEERDIWPLLQSRSIALPPHQGL